MTELSAGTGRVPGIELRAGEESDIRTESKARMPFEVKLYVLSVVMLQLYPSIGIIIPGLKQPMVYISMSCIIMSMVLFLVFKNGIKYFNRKTTIYFITLTYSVAFIFIMRLYGNGYQLAEYIPRETNTDLISILTYMSGVLFISGYAKKHIRNILLILGFFGIINGIIALRIGDFTVLDRSNVWTDSYVLWFSLFPWSSLLIFYFVAPISNTKLKMLITLFTAVLYSVLSILFLKRVIIVEIFLVTGIIYISQKNFKRAVKTTLYSAMLVIFVLILNNLMDWNIGRYFAMTISRFEGVESLDSYSRVREYTDGTGFFNLYNYLFGVGLGGVHFAFGMARGNMHIAWLNYLFKGGVLFFATQLFAFWNSIMVYLRSRKIHDSFNLAVAAAAIFLYASGVINTYWGATASSMVLSMLVFSSLSTQRMACDTDKSLKS